MKTRKLVALGFISAVALGMAAQTVHAAGGSQTTTGEVDFTLETPVQPPVGPGPIDPPGPGPAGDEDLRIVYAMDFDFSTQNYDSTTAKTVYAQDYEYTQKFLDEEGNPVLVPGEDGETMVPKTEKYKGPLGISIANSSSITYWKLQVKADAFKKVVGEGQTGKTLDNGMFMTLNNVKVNTVVGQAAEATLMHSTTEGGTATSSAPNLPLTTGVTQEVGTYNHPTDSATSLNNFAFLGENYTTPTDWTAKPEMPTEYKGVSLYLPTGLDIQSGEKYTSTITWTLSDVE